MEVCLLKNTIGTKTYNNTNKQTVPSNNLIFMQNNTLNLQFKPTKTDQTMKHHKYKQKLENFQNCKTSILLKFTNNQKYQKSTNSFVSNRLKEANKITERLTFSKHSPKTNTIPFLERSLKVISHNPENQQDKNKSINKQFLFKFNKSIPKRKYNRVKTQQTDLNQSRKSQQQLNFKFKQILSQPIQRSMFASSKLIEQLKSPITKSFKIELNDMVTNSRLNGKVNSRKIGGVLKFHNKAKSRLHTKQQSQDQDSNSNRYSYSKFYDQQIISIRTKRNSK